VSLERALVEIRDAAVARIVELWPAPLAIMAPDHIEGWKDVANGYLTKDGDWRAKGVPPTLIPLEEVRQVLHEIRSVPDAAYTDDQWEALDAIVKLAPRAVAE